MTSVNSDSMDLVTCRTEIEKKAPEISRSVVQTGNNYRGQDGTKSVSVRQASKKHQTGVSEILPVKFPRNGLCS